MTVPTNIGVDVLLGRQLGVSVESVRDDGPVDPLEVGEVPEESVHPVLADAVHPAGPALVTGGVIRSLQCPVTFSSPDEALNVTWLLKLCQRASWGLPMIAPDSTNIPMSLGFFEAAYHWAEDSMYH